jgi:hypothetical protein
MSYKTSQFFENACLQHVSTDADFARIESKNMLFLGGILKFSKKCRTCGEFNERYQLVSSCK